MLMKHIKCVLYLFAIFSLAKIMYDRIKHDMDDGIYGGIKES